MRHERHLTDRYIGRASVPIPAPHPFPGAYSIRPPGDPEPHNQGYCNYTLPLARWAPYVRQPPLIILAAISSELTMDAVHMVMMVMVATVMMVPIVPAIVMVSMPHRDFLDGRCDCDGWR